MFQLKRIFLSVTIVTCLLIQAQGADKYTDENRPYEFGFSIDGEQHRHEKKDTNGIIMGEYGFITADGVYHVTVYATDEFGHFKILSMKNIRVKPYPTVSSRQGHSLELPLSQQAPASQAQSPSQALSPPNMQHTSPVSAPVQPPQEAHTFETVKNELPSKSCSHCSLPTTTTRAPPAAPVDTLFVASALKYDNPNKIGTSQLGSPQYFQEKQAQLYPNQQSNPQQSSVEGQQNSKNNPQQISGPPQSFSSQQHNLKDNNVPIQLNYPQQESQQISGSPQSFSGQQHNLKDNNIPIQLNYPQQESQQISGSPQSFSGQQHNLKDNNVPIQLNYPQQGFSQILSPPENYVSQKNNDNIFGQQNYVQQGQEQSHPGQQFNQEPINNFNSATKYPLQSSGSSQRSPQQNSLQQSGPQKSPQGPGSAQEFLQQGVNVRNNNNPQQRVDTSYDDSGVGPSQNNGIKPNDNSGGTLRSAKQYNPLEQSPIFNAARETTAFGSPQVGSIPKKPILLAAQMQIVDKNTDIHYKRPGEQDGLPEGLTKDDMTHLLYTFNYTLGFQGHFEEGYTNGAKQGYYFVTGRNGVRTRVDYVADNNGFRPKITQEVLDLLSDEVPKPDTEKDAKYGLKGYEFKWLYYPAEAKA